MIPFIFQVNALQQRISQLMADLDRRQDEYSEMVSGLTRSHEDQLQRQANHLAAVSEQRLAEINVSDQHILRLFSVVAVGEMFFCSFLILRMAHFVFILRISVEGKVASRGTRAAAPQH